MAERFESLDCGGDRRCPMNTPPLSGRLLGQRHAVDDDSDRADRVESGEVAGAEVVRGGACDAEHAVALLAGQVVLAAVTHGRLYGSLSTYVPSL